MAEHNKDGYVNAAVLVRQHVQDYLDNSPEVETTFAIKVRDAYEAAVPKHARTIQFSDNPDPILRLEADRNKVFGFLGNTLRRRLPVEIVEFVIASLPERRRFALQSALAARQQILAVPMPKVAGASMDAEALARVSEEVGDVFRACGELLANDGVIDEKDAPKAPEAVRQIDELAGVLMSLRERIVKQALAGDENVVPMEKRA